LIGPEGDFTPDEVTLAVKNGIKPVSLGQSRLRTETAAVVVCAAIKIEAQY
jgi:16S rRNA (uracil1498-N3)-methyltransferase